MITFLLESVPISFKFGTQKYTDLPVEDGGIELGQVAEQLEIQWRGDS